MPKVFAAGAIILCLILAAGPAGCAARSAADPSTTPDAAAMDGYRSPYNPAHIGSDEAWDIMSADSAALMLDVRSQASYVENHVSVAVNVPFESVAEYAEANIPDKDRAIIFYCFCGDKGGSALSACELLAERGYTRVFYTEPGDEWTYEGTAVADNSGRGIVSGLEAKALCDSNAAAVLLDVRNQDEYDAEHIGGSLLIPVSELETRLSELPDKDAVIIVYCKAGARSATAYSILAAHGYVNVYDMQKVGNWPEPLVAAGGN